MVSANPWGGGEHNDIDRYQGDHTPCHDRSRGVFRVAVLERADGEEEEPRDATRSTTGVNTTDVLNKAGQENAPP